MRMTLLCLAAVFCLSRPALAQGVVWELPEAGSWVRLEGTYKQTELRPDSSTGNVEIPAWVERVTIKSVGSEQGQYQGEATSCRWIEIKIERGREQDGKLETGVAGLEVYKILVPERGVVDRPRDSSTVPVSFLPVVKGYRKIGNRPAKPLDSQALQLYPVGLLIGYYRDVKIEEKAANVNGPKGQISAVRWAGDLVVERGGSRTRQTSTIYRSADVPFGVARLDAKIVREIKDERADRNKFTPATEVVVSLKLAEIGRNAVSELNVP